MPLDMMIDGQHETAADEFDLDMRVVADHEQAPQAKTIISILCSQVQCG
ncbi:hypothetical protein [Saccharopolyspora rosea]|uniref:Uncharacterized protein n=1 Tax=Saccharopolyspora rosea TaxID=524884 RepID=A0ABW3FY37_9PSEU|nr:hypothetical protein [Saccharopolyspora rosea]